eukprot:5349503-Pleurochrysis_carterae.AAC.1
MCIAVKSVHLHCYSLADSKIVFDIGAYSAIENCDDKVDCGDDVDAETRRLLASLPGQVGLDRYAARDGTCEPRMLA